MKKHKLLNFIFSTYQSSEFEFWDRCSVSYWSQQYQQRNMNSLKQFLGISHRSQTLTHVNNFLKRSGFSAQGQLNSHYDKFLSSSVIRCEDPNQFVQILINKLSTEKNQGRRIKLFTILHKFAVMTNYNQETIGGFTKISPNSEAALGQQKWLNDLSNAYCIYLARLESVSDILEKINRNKRFAQPQLQMSQIFRLVNSVGKLFPVLNQTIKIVGRYHQFQFVEIRELYRVLSSELTNIYNYINDLKDLFFDQYSVLKPSDLKGFIQYLPQIESFCQNIEDFLVNKYMNESISIPKCFFDENKIIEIIYYLEIMKEQEGSETATSHTHFGSEQNQIENNSLNLPTDLLYSQKGQARVCSKNILKRSCI